MHSKKYLIRRIIVLVLFCFLMFALFVGIRSGILFAKERFFKKPKKLPEYKLVEGKLNDGEDLHTALIRNKVDHQAANEIILSLDKLLDFRKLHSGDVFRIYKNKINRIDKFIYEKSAVDQYFLVRDESIKFNAFKPAIYLDKKKIVKEFTISTSLFDAMKRAGEKDALLLNYVDIFAWDIDFNLYPRKGDKIKIFFEKEFKDDDFVRYGRILAAQYIGRDKFSAIYFDAPDKKKKGYYNPLGEPMAKMFLKSPLKFTGRITSYFGRRRDPITFRPGRHNGVDFASYYGAPVISTSDGTVTFTGWRGVYGKLVIVKHGNGFETRYGHCSKLLTKRGAKVRQGQIIATVGSTGRSTGPHCHYEVHVNNRLANPLMFSQPKKDPLSGADLKLFQSQTRSLWSNFAKL
ncbi:M23 family metallopeptidase [Candidatus Margulisiibacteriota bacterium]